MDATFIAIIMYCLFGWFLYTWPLYVTVWPISLFQMANPKLTVDGRYTWKLVFLILSAPILIMFGTLFVVIPAFNILDNLM